MFFRSIILNNFLYQNYFYPSYLSTSRGCFPETYKNDTKVIAAGQTNLRNGNISVNIRVSKENIENYIRVIKHENCHVNQIQQKRLYSCKNKGVLRYINEMECYITQEFNDVLYYKIYTDNSVLFGCSSKLSSCSSTSGSSPSSLGSSSSGNSSYSFSTPSLKVELSSDS